jgi:predicted HicB family RNase H-like nuclease
LSRKEAIQWAEAKELDADRIEAMFGEIPEAGMKSWTMLLRLPEALKRRMENDAGEANQSVNAYAIRCMEFCSGLDEIKERVARIAWVAEVCQY